MARMSRTQRVALRRVNEPMEAWDPLTESWLPAAFIARFDPTDRFLSNFNKPTRRRMLQAADDCVFPESRTFRHPGTQDVYLLGVTRKDSLGGNPYLGLTVCQLVTDVPGGSSGLATIYRREALGPPENPGWLVERVFAKAYMDMEFRTSANEPDATDLKIENYYAFLPLSVQPQEWDFIELHGVRYRVVDTFADSGFFGLRIDHENDFRTDFTLNVMHGRRLNPTTQQYEDGSDVYQVTGMLERAVDFPVWNKDSETYFDVYFEVDHLPNIDFSAVRNEMRLRVGSIDKTVVSISTQSGKRQYKFRCK
jgi:hypothetical protein